MILIGSTAMIVRLSQKLAKKLKAAATDTLPLDENPYADWSAHLFTAGRTQYIIVTNTKSLYSVVMFGKGITNDSRFIERALSNIREFMEDDGQEFVYRRFIAPASGTIRFGKALNRSVQESTQFAGEVSLIVKQNGRAGPPPRVTQHGSVT